MQSYSTNYYIRYSLLTVPWVIRLFIVKTGAIDFLSGQGIIFNDVVVNNVVINTNVRMSVTHV